jgi:pyridoxal phosphate enzyme (YggS family)
MTSMAFTASSVAAQLAAVRARIDGVARPWTHDVAVVAVTKGFDGTAIAAAVEAGCVMVGENKAQELLSKLDVVDRLRPEVHFIGHVQSNKVRQIAGIVSVWDTLDRESVIREVARRAPAARVLLQVNATGESQKSGCLPDTVEGLVAMAVELGLNVEGLMTMGPTAQPPEAARSAFREVRALVDELGLGTCSMGMTADLEVAVAEGATHVRVGSALFGPRPSN